MAITNKTLKIISKKIRDIVDEIDAMADTVSIEEAETPEANRLWECQSTLELCRQDLIES